MRSAVWCRSNTLDVTDARLLSIIVGLPVTEGSLSQLPRGVSPRAWSLTGKTSRFAGGLRGLGKRAAGGDIHSNLTRLPRDSAENLFHPGYPRRLRAVFSLAIIPCVEANYQSVWRENCWKFSLF